ncbi:MAG: efflux RND transporter periplasmic adaptor subunit [Balneolaceae bacterium]|nr:efflux RND transporter periplasmic adaptor subunit [Balneolaceae bacterium]MBO6545454.1 efflux RND transporter periplasmic adaptor subunit [Balneolaceae bacterium]MBO6646850.1 efflux RND transporter periplasmic adaptor subunit [Balneolaceae bacterium]
MFNNNKIIAITTLVAIAAAVFGVMTFKSENKSAIQVQTVSVDLGEVITTVTATGTLQPTTQVEVGTQVSGEVEKIYVDFNSSVKAGQLIAELDKTNLKAVVAQAKASYQNAENEVNYREGIYSRKKALFEQNLITEEEFELAEYNYNTAKFSLNQRASDLEQAETNLGYADIYSPISGVVLSREVDEGQTVAASLSTPTLFNIAKDLKEMQVEADVDEADIGQVEEGQRVSFTVDSYPGEEFNGTVTQVRLNPTTTSNVVTYTVVVDADNDDMKLKPGMTATITIYTQELVNVLTIQSKATTFTPNLEILEQYYEQEGISLPEGMGENSEASLGEDRPPRDGERRTRPSDDQNSGLPNVDLARGERPEGPPPSGAFLPEMGEEEDGVTVVFVVNEDGLVVPRRIETGASDGINIEVLSGLEEGDVVVYRVVEVTTEEATTEKETTNPFIPSRPGR